MDQTILIIKIPSLCCLCRKPKGSGVSTATPSQASLTGHHLNPVVFTVTTPLPLQASLSPWQILPSCPLLPHTPLVKSRLEDCPRTGHWGMQKLGLDRVCGESAHRGSGIQFRGPKGPYSMLFPRSGHLLSSVSKLIPP